MELINGCVAWKGSLTPKGILLRIGWPIQTTNYQGSGASMKLMLEEGGEEITWEFFKKKFYVEYFHDSVQYTKEVEFL